MVLFGILFPDDDFVNEQRWALGTEILDILVSEDKRQQVVAALNEEYRYVWSKIGNAMLEKVINNTAMLALGWVIHLFLS